ncbi:MAG: beta-lactamase family protein [Acidobacteria bacterium]|nr:beta-lactamase family protein [Acidobacteriota bacterium]
MCGADRLADYLKHHLEAGDFPGAVYLVAENGRILAEGALGLAVVRPERIAATSRTLYDLASLTKPLAGALLAALLDSEGRLSLDHPLACHLPEWTRAGAGSRITLLDLLVHRSGLPAWRPLYLNARDRAACIERLNGEPLERPPGAGVLYSDPGYVLLGFALERAGGAPLDELFLRKVAGPLGLTDLLFRPPGALRRRIAATEEGSRRERALAGPQGDRYNGWRTEVAWGEVHDLNARLLGGVSAHAGLFGTARDILAVAREILDPGAGPGAGLLDRERRALFAANLTAGLGENRSLGFQIAGGSGGAAGEALSARSFGHTGFTGTSLWIDPDARRIYVLLTNRVHPEFREIDMNAIRRGFHEAAAAL